MANYTANHTSLPVWHYTSSNSLEDKNSPSCYSLPTKWTKTSEWVFTFTLHWIGGWHWIVSGVHHQLQYKGLLPFQHIHDSAKLNTKLHKYMHTALTSGKLINALRTLDITPRCLMVHYWAWLHFIKFFQKGTWWLLKMSWWHLEMTWHNLRLLESGASSSF